ncbi:MAG: barstar family protein [Fluviicola sp.]
MSSRVEKIDGLTYLVAELDASKASSYRKLYFHLKEIYQFPETPGNNYSAVLMDYMTDLGWFRERNFKLIVRNMQKAGKLDAKTMADFRSFLETLSENWKIIKARNGRDREDHFIIEFADGSLNNC